MLIKLVKHDLKSLKILNLAYVAVLILALINRFTIKSIENSEGLQVLSTLMIILYVLAIFVVLTISSIYVIVLFYQDVVGKRSYLIHSLPVTKDEIICSKILTGAIISIASLLIFIVSLNILLPIEVKEGFQMEFQLMFYQVKTMDIASNLSYIIPGVIMILITPFTTYLSYFFAITFSQLEVFGSNRILNTILTIIIMGVIGQIFGMFFSVIIGITGIYKFVDIFLYLTLAVTLLTSAFYYIGTRYIMKNKINVQ